MSSTQCVVSSASYTCGTSAAKVTRSPAASSTGPACGPRAGARDDEEVLDDAGVVGVGVPDGARLEVERVEVEGPARGARRSAGRPPSPAPRPSASAARRGADDAQRRPLLLDEPRERDLQRRADRPQRLHARVAPAGLELRERRLAQARPPRPARRASARLRRAARGRWRRRRGQASRRRSRLSGVWSTDWTKVYFHGIFPSSWKPAPL